MENPLNPETLKQKIGPFPAYVWVVGAVGIGALFFFLRSKGYLGGTASSSTAALPPSSVPIDTTGGANGSGGSTLIPTPTGGGTSAYICPDGSLAASPGACAGAAPAVAPVGPSFPVGGGLTPPPVASVGPSFPVGGGIITPSYSPFPPGAPQQQQLYVGGPLNGLPISGNYPQTQSPFPPPYANTPTMPVYGPPIFAPPNGFPPVNNPIYGQPNNYSQYGQGGTYQGFGPNSTLTGQPAYYVGPQGGHFAPVYNPSTGQWGPPQ